MKNIVLLATWAFLLTVVSCAEPASKVNCTSAPPYLRSPTPTPVILNVHGRGGNSVASKSWHPVVAVLCSALGLSLLLVLLSKAWRYHTRVSSYRHKHIDEQEDVDEGQGSGLCASQRIPGYRGFEGTVPTHLGVEADDTEDGFIEDEYVKDSDMVVVEHEEDSD
ncbi:uncharacterized protein LOC144733288 [Lampetra planeri]